MCCWPSHTTTHVSASEARGPGCGCTSCSWCLKSLPTHTSSPRQHPLAVLLFNSLPLSCQSMNYLAAMLLLALGRDEEEAFWVLACLIDDEDEGAGAAYTGCGCGQGRLLLLTVCHPQAGASAVQSPWGCTCPLLPQSTLGAPSGPFYPVVAASPPLRSCPDTYTRTHTYYIGPVQPL
jgi:hypothetical protein